MSPTPTPPPYPPLDLTPSELSPTERIERALNELRDTSTADLDALLDGVTITTAPYLIPTLLIGAVVVALIVFAHSRVMSPEAQARYTDLIHAKRERAVKARIAERRARDEAREAVTDDVSSGTS